jgi:hypothetical protein
MASSDATAIVISPDLLPAEKESLRKLIADVAARIERDAALTRDSTGGQAAKFIGSLVVGGAVAARVESLTPLKWAARGFGPLPYELTKSGAIQVFELSFAQRAVRVAVPAVAKAALVFVAFNAGVYVGAAINQTLSDEVQDAIGGTLNEIINEGGWKDIWRNPFGWRMWAR